jgi:hypothetical protein
VTGDASVGLGFRDFLVTDEIPGAGGDEAQGFDALGGVGEEDVAGDLFLDEAIVAFVGVERTDDVIAVRPGVGAGFVFVVTLGVAVVDDVEPVARPAFAVAGGGEQAVDETFVGPRMRVGDEGRDFLGGGRQPDEIEGHAADERSSVGGR